SSVLTTAPWGKTDQPDFANMAIAVETSLEPIDLLDGLLAIELAMGRVREEVWGPRLIDIDIIAYERQQLQTARLTLPHPHAHEREFVTMPLAKSAPGLAAWTIARGGGAPWPRVAAASASAVSNSTRLCARRAAASAAWPHWPVW